MKLFLKILMWVLIIAAVIGIVILFSVIISDELGSVGDLFDFIHDEYEKGDGVLKFFLNLPWLAR